MERNKIRLSEPYQRTLSSALSVVEEMLSEIDDLLKAQHIGAIFTHVVNTLDNEHQQFIAREVESMRRKLQDIKMTLGLNSITVSNARLISSRCGKIWELLCDLEARRLRGYGDPPDGLADYLDCRIHDLIRSMGRIAELTGKKENGDDV